MNEEKREQEKARIEVEKLFDTGLTQLVASVSQRLNKKGAMNCILGFSLISVLLGCAGFDPDESGVPNGQDFQFATVVLNGGDLDVEVGFYDDYAGNDFFLYFDHDLDGVADSQVTCSDTSCTVYKTAGGSIVSTNFDGPPTVAGKLLSFSFPESALEVVAPNTSNYWLFRMQQAGNAEDRMPDSGFEQLTF